MPMDSFERFKRKRQITATRMTGGRYLTLIFILSIYVAVIFMKWK
ncbi:hypothetical protein [Sporosarcina sp. E16_8]|nr:hypothetical protein [Sporosarcina sp. E16_8]